MWLKYLLVVNNRRKQEPSFANCLIKHQILITKVIRNIWQMGGDFILRSQSDRVNLYVWENSLINTDK